MTTRAIRFDDKMWKDIKKKASSYGMTPSALLRMVLADHFQV